MTMFPYTIRPVRPEEDAAEAAQLIRTCFRPWLDKGNMDYLDRLYAEGIYARKHPMLTALTSFPYPMEGVVCRSPEGALLGLINTYPFTLNSRRCCLIANVCTDPSHRSEGIASHMLEEVERTQIGEGIRGIFLQARLAMPETIRFYRQRGFRVTDYRETWVLPGKRSYPYEGPALFAERVQEQDRKEFYALLKAEYPVTVRWNLNYKKELFGTGIVSEIRRRIGSPRNRSISVRDESGRILARAAYQEYNSFADRLWLIPGADISEDEYSAVLRYLGAKWGGKRALQLDIPAGKDPELLKDTGFCYMQTLAWMWKKL